MLITVLLDNKAHTLNWFRDGTHVRPCVIGVLQDALAFQVAVWRDEMRGCEFV